MALVTNIQRFSTHDGDGIRTTVFFKGCPLNCAWCHNPENIKPYNEIFYVKASCMHCRMCEQVCKNHAHAFTDTDHIYVKENCKLCLRCAEVCPTKALEIVSKEMTVDEVLTEVLKDKVFFGKEGGITLSGGEPLIYSDFALELLTKAKEAGITTCVETCGYFDSEIIPSLVRVTDMFLYDIKDGDEERHIKYTGKGYERILNNLFLIDKYNGKIILRCIMVKGANMDKTHYDFIAEIYRKLKNGKGVELLPYHAYGGSKNQQLGYSDNGNEEWVPRKEEIEEVKRYLIGKGVTII